MKTTIDIPEKELQEVIQLTGASTKKQAVLEAIRDYARRHRLSEAAKILGTFDEFMTSEELESQRRAD